MAAGGVLGRAIERRLHREAESFAVVSLLGVFYRRGVASSLTQIGDVRQLDFIRAFDQVIEETAQDPDADRLLPKAVRTYCAIIAHHRPAHWPHDRAAAWLDDGRLCDRSHQGRVHGAAHR